MMSWMTSRPSGLRTSDSRRIRVRQRCSEKWWKMWLAMPDWNDATARGLLLAAVRHRYRPSTTSAKAPASAHCPCPALRQAGPGRGPDGPGERAATAAPVEAISLERERPGVL
jgi:hypothetical protein